MIIHWVVSGVYGDESGGFQSKLASNRYRVIIPAAGLRRLGHQVVFVNADSWQSESELPLSMPDVLVLGKLLPGASLAEYARTSHRVLSNAYKMREFGCTVIADINDDHFRHPQLGTHWRGLTGCVNGFTAGSSEMAAIIREYSGLPVVVVGDPVGAPLETPKVYDRGRGVAGLMQKAINSLGYLKSRLHMVWYGSHTNWPAMADWAGKLTEISSRQPYLITVISTPGTGIEEYIEKYNNANQPRALMQFVEWDVEEVWGRVKQADIVLIPSVISDQKKMVKTANRLLDALACGRFPVATPVPSYKEYADFAWLGDDPVQGVEWVLKHPSHALNKIQLGQQVLLEKASPDVMAYAWQKAIKTIVAASQSSGQVVTPGRDVIDKAQTEDDRLELRLNLGCGDKILEGYTNVDVAPSRGGKKPDVLCDLHKLDQFDSNSANEILAVHVVEHFWRWEVVDILREWVRVLRPGGKMILECPNLKSACEEFVRNPEVMSKPDQNGQRTMWVFYGDPAWHDPLMVHRWGYTPGSLSEVMQEAGLVDVRQEPAQYKLREPRDMRIVGIKPGVLSASQ